MWQTCGIVYLCVFSDNKKYIGSTSRGIGEESSYWGGNEEIENRVGNGNKPKLVLLAYACDEEELVIKETLFQIANCVENSDEFLNKKIERKELAEEKLQVSLEDSQLSILQLDDTWIFKNLQRDNFDASVPGDKQTILVVDDHVFFKSPILHCDKTANYEELAKNLELE